LAPHDFIVLNNIAHVHDNKKDKANAIKYYELTLRHGDDESKEHAKKKLQELRK
jgi:hypothetical protein